MAKAEYYSSRRLGFARKMRHEATDAERRLWSVLRAKRFDGYKFRRQHLIDCYIVDFCCLAPKVVVELDGSQHGEAAGKAYDAARTQRLADLGFRVLRFWDDEVLKYTDVVANAIYLEVTTGPSPRPSPGVPGEGERGEALGAAAETEGPGAARIAGEGDGGVPQ